MNTLTILFGSKYLPDEEPTLKITAAEDCVRMAKEEMGIVESKPAEPKYKLWDLVVYDGAVHKIVGVLPCAEYYLSGHEYAVSESDLEPYTEPEKEYRNLSLSEQQEAAWNNIPSKLKEKIESKYAEYNVEAFNGFAVGYCAAIRDIFGHDRFEVVK